MNGFISAWMASSPSRPCSSASWAFFSSDCVQIRILRRVHAMPARWRGDAGSSLLDRASSAPDALVDFHTGSDATMGLRLNFLDGIHLRGSPKFMTGVPLGSTTLSRPFASCLLWRSWALRSTRSRRSFNRRSFSSFESGFGPTSVGRQLHGQARSDFLREGLVRQSLAVHFYRMCFYCHRHRPEQCSPCSPPDSWLARRSRPPYYFSSASRCHE